MKILAQLGIIMGICLAGEFLSLIIPIPFPSSVLSMLILFFLLLLRPLKTEHLKESADFLLQNMAFFFIPAGVGVMESFSLVQGKILPLLLICFISTVITFAAASLTVSLVIRLQKKISARTKS